MVHTTVRGFALMATMALGGLAAAQDKKADKPAEWGKLVDPDGDCKLASSDGAVTITIPNTHHNLTHTDTGTKLNAPRLLRDATGDFQLEVKVPEFPLPQPNTSVDGKYSFVSAGLLVWNDDNSFVRFERAAEGRSQVPFVWVEIFKNGISADRKIQRIEDKEIYLRVIRAGEKLTFETSEDGKKWTTVHTAKVKLPAAVKVGGLAINTTTKEFSPKLAGMTLKAK